MRRLVYQFMPPAYCVSEMLSAHDFAVTKSARRRYLDRSIEENILCYQLSGTHAEHLFIAAQLLATCGADLIDINCGCPKGKIRKKGAGSALLETPDLLVALITQVRAAISIPLTVKLRLHHPDTDNQLAQRLEQAGADALIVHARRAVDDYNVSCNWQQVAAIKRSVSIPVIANGDMATETQLASIYEQTGCDAFMISRAGCGQPWLFERLLTGTEPKHSQKALFKQHLHALAALENEHQAILQSKSLVRYYFRNNLNTAQLEHFLAMQQLSELDNWLLKLPD